MLSATHMVVSRLQSTRNREKVNVSPPKVPCMMCSCGRARGKGNTSGGGWRGVTWASVGGTPAALLRPGCCSLVPRLAGHTTTVA